LFDLHEGPSLGRSGTLLSGPDIGTSPDQIGAEGFLLPLLLGSRLFELGLQFLATRLRAGMGTPFGFQLGLGRTKCLIALSQFGTKLAIFADAP